MNPIPKDFGRSSVDSNSRKGQIIGLSVFVYDVACVALAVPAGLLMRTNSLWGLTIGLVVLQVGFVAVTAALLGLGMRGGKTRSPLHDLVQVLRHVIVGMVVATIVTFLAVRLEGVPRIVPFLAALSACIMIALPRLAPAWPELQRLVQRWNAKGATERDASGPGGRLLPSVAGISFKQWSDIAIVWFLPAAIMMSAFGPQGLTWFCIILAAVLVLSLALETPPADWLRDLGRISSVVIPIVAFMGWAILRSAFSPAAATSIPALFAFAAPLLAVIVAAFAADRLQPGPRWFWKFFPLVNILAAVALMLIFVFLLVMKFPLGSPIRLTHPWHYNRLALLVVLLLPISLFAIRKMILSPMDRRLWQAAVVAAVMAATFSSESQSAQLSLIVILAVHLASLVRVAWTRLILAAGVVIALLFAPVLCKFLFWIVKETELWAYSPGTFAARIMIWLQAIALIESAPIFGNGVEIMRFLSDSVADRTVQSTQGHAHSFLLQTWADLGLIGAVLLMICLLSMIWTLRNFSDDAARMFLAIVAGVLTIWSVSHGMWQSWYVGLSGIVVTFAFLVNRRAANNQSFLPGETARHHKADRHDP